jgi:hypothetical protein
MKITKQNNDTYATSCEGNKDPEEEEQKEDGAGECSPLATGWSWKQTLAVLCLILRRFPISP